MISGDRKSRERTRGDSARLRVAARRQEKGGVRMKIAQVSPLYESCPPRLYGGTERIVHYLTEELVGLGHEVTLFASGDSQTSAVLEPGCEQALRLDDRCKDPLVYHMTMLHRLRRRAAEFDIIHFHTDYLHMPF